jgi:hypothetical protein
MRLCGQTQTKLIVAFCIDGIAPEQYYTELHTTERYMRSAQCANGWSLEVIRPLALLCDKFPTVIPGTNTAEATGKPV